jgi:hypothetical protein
MPSKDPNYETSETRRKYKAEWYEKNKVEITARRKKFREANPIPLEKQREYNFRYQYGIGMDEYYTLLEQQNYVCLICNTKHGEKDKQRLHVDHCHETGKVRGLLCHNCNVVLGLSKENIDIFKKMISYLEEHSA